MINKYVIYKGSGGLIHMLGGLSYCADWCNRNNHYLIIDVKNHDAYKKYLKDYFYLEFKNYTEDYNVIPNDLHFKNISIDIIEKTNVVYKRNNNRTEYILGKDINIMIDLDTYDYNDKVKIYCGTGGSQYNLITKYVRVNLDICKILEKKDMSKINYCDIGVHFRNTDRKNDINEFVNRIKKYNKKTFYLATDDYYALEKFKNILPNYNIITLTTPYNANGKNIHYNNDNKDELIMNILIDMYILLKLDIFIHSSNSLVSKLILYMKKTNTSLFQS